MSMKSNIIRAIGLGALVTAISAGAAMAAVATGNVNVRSGPGPSYRVVDRLFPGQVVGITDRAGPWCEISKPGRDGWVACSYLSQSRVIERPRYRGYDRYDRYDRGPSFSFSFGNGGFGQPPRGHDDHNDHHDGDHGPRDGNNGGMFSIN